jgi:translation initiation factor 1
LAFSAAISMLKDRRYREHQVLIKAPLNKGAIEPFHAQKPSHRTPNRNPNQPTHKKQNPPTQPKHAFHLKLLYTSVDNSLLSVMAEVCSTCGLPKDLCVCGEIEKEQQRIRIRLETRKFGRSTTIIDGMDDKNSDLPSIAQKLKTYCACGGTSKNGLIMLQGDHRDRVREFLIKMGYPEENIELQ